MNPPLPSPRLRFRRQPLWERIQTAVMVAVFTGLIWWNANESVRASRTFSVRLIVAKVAGHVVRITSANEFNVTVAGSKRLLDGFAEQLRARQNAIEYRLPEGDMQMSQDRTVRSAKEVLSEASLLEGSGLTVIEASPGEVIFWVDRLVETTMAVEPDFGHLKVEGVTVVPPAVRVNMAQRERAEHSGKLAPAVEEQLRAWRAEHPDQSAFSIRVAVTPPPGAESIDPRNVTVSGTIIQLLASEQKGPVQVFPAIPMTLQERFFVQPAHEDGFRIDLAVRGSKERLADLNAEQIKAYVDIFTADEGHAGQDIARRIVVVLPEGIELVGDPPEVTFRLVSKDAAGPGGP